MGNILQKENDIPDKDPWENVSTETWESITFVALNMHHVTVVLLDNNETQLHFDSPLEKSQGDLYRSLAENFGQTMDRRVAKKLFATVVNCSKTLDSVTFRVGSQVWVFQKDYGVKELQDYFHLLLDSDLAITKLRIRELLPIEELLVTVPPLISRFHKSLRELEVDHVMQGLWHVISICENLTDLSVAYPEGRKPRDLETALAGKFLRKLEVVAIHGLNPRELSVSLTTLAESPTYLRIVNCPEVSLGKFLPLAPVGVLENLRHLTCESGKLPLAKYESAIKETAIEEENSALKLIPRLCPNIEEIGGAGTLALGLIKAFLDRYSMLAEPRTLQIGYADHITLQEFAYKIGNRIAIRPHILKVLNCDEATALFQRDDEQNAAEIGTEWLKNNNIVDKINENSKICSNGHVKTDEDEVDDLKEFVKFQRGNAIVIGKFSHQSFTHNEVANGTMKHQA